MYRVIRCARYAKHFITGTQNAKQRSGERVCAAGEIMAHKRILRAENISPYPVKRVSSAVSVSVAGS